GVSELSPDGLTPSEQLDAVRVAATALLHRGRAVFLGIRDALAAEHIFLHDYEDLTSEQRARAEAYFDETVFPVLTPLAFDPGRPFPHISNLSLNLAVLVRSSSGEERFARVKIPKALPRLVPVGPSGSESGVRREHHFVWIEQLVSARLGALFPGMEVVEVHPFRVTRDAEMAIQELEADDLLSSIEEGVRRRRFGSVVRVTVNPGMPAFIRDILLENLKVTPADVITLGPPLGGSDLMELYKLDRPDLKYEPFVPVVPSSLEDAAEEGHDLFAAIRERDIMLHRPFESFEPVVRLIRQAAADPDVLAIKMTLYRVGRNSPIVEALLDAATEGKEVTALVELKARFDEESNIEWARALEAEGVHVVYGLLGLKTHSKVALVVRREGGKIRRYLHAGTGNYNTVTALEYTDLDFLTADENMADDATALFNYLTGWAEAHDFERFLVAPAGLRSGFEALVRREMEHARVGREARLRFKMNALVDPQMITLLYEASQAGVTIDLIVRGVCCLKPGIPGVSETITVRSIVGRFLEHTRIYYFENAGDPTCLIGSADLMPRNLDRRVEVLVPILDPALVGRLRDEVLAVYFADNTTARVMHSDGTWERLRPAPGEQPVDAQSVLLSRARG
ncbi:MAG: polyphosphate kinase 1, partial [Coriobacteriales bacterium]